MYEESADALPVLFKVESFNKNAAGEFTGCVIRAYRLQKNPDMQPLNVLAILGAVVTGVNSIVAALSGRSNTEGSAEGVKFYCTAVLRTD